MSKIILGTLLLMSVVPLHAVKAEETTIGLMAEDIFEACESTADLWSQPTLTGDWHGLRPALQESGVTIAGRSTHFAFGVDGGVQTLPPIPLLPLGLGDTFKYTGRGEYDLIVDLEKFGGLPHGSLLVRLEHWYGEFANVSLRTGAFTPAVFPAALPPVPNSAGTLYLTNFVVTQPLSERLVVFAGKKDVLKALDQDVFAGGDGTDQFVNQALIANPAFLLGLPYTGFVVGAAMPQEWGMISTFAYDPKDRTQDAFEFGDLFAAGVILGGEVRVNTNFFERKGGTARGRLVETCRTDGSPVRRASAGGLSRTDRPGIPNAQ